MRHTHTYTHTHNQHAQKTIAPSLGTKLMGINDSETLVYFQSSKKWPDLVLTFCRSKTFAIFKELKLKVKIFLYNCTADNWLSSKYFIGLLSCSKTPVFQFSKILEKTTKFRPSTFLMVSTPDASRIARGTISFLCEATPI